MDNLKKKITRKQCSYSYCQSDDPEPHYIGLLVNCHPSSFSWQNAAKNETCMMDLKWWMNTENQI